MSKIRIYTCSNTTMQRIADIVLQKQNLNLDDTKKIDTIKYEQKEVIIIGEEMCPIIHYVLHINNKKTRSHSKEDTLANYFGIKIGDLFKYFRACDSDTVFDKDVRNFYKNVLKLELDYNNSPILFFGGISGHVVTNKILGSYNYQSFANSTVVFANPLNLTQFSERNLLNIVTEYVNSIHCVINSANMQYLLDAYYMRNQEDDADVIEFDEPKSLVDIIQIYHSDNSVIRKLAKFITNKSRKSIYQKDPYVYTPAIIKAWRREIDVEDKFLSPEILINAHFSEWNLRNSLEGFTNCYMRKYLINKNKIQRKIQIDDDNNFSSEKFTTTLIVEEEDNNCEWWRRWYQEEYTTYFSKNHIKSKGFNHCRYNDREIRHSEKYAKGTRGSKVFTEKFNKVSYDD